HGIYPPSRCWPVGLQCRDRGTNLAWPRYGTATKTHQTPPHPSTTPRHPRPGPRMPSTWLHRASRLLRHPPHHRLATRWHHRRNQRHRPMLTPPRRRPHRQMDHPKTQRTDVLPTRTLAGSPPTTAPEYVLEQLALQECLDSVPRPFL